MLQSHNHYDHLVSTTVRRIASLHPGATWVAPLNFGATLRRFCVRDVVELDWRAAGLDASRLWVSRFGETRRW